MVPAMSHEQNSAKTFDSYFTIRPCRSPPQTIECSEYKIFTCGKKFAHAKKLAG